MISRQMIRTLVLIIAAASTVLFASCGGGGGKRSITPPLSSNTQLKSLSISNCGSVFIDYSPDTYAYGPYTQGNDTASYTVTAEKAEEKQVVTIGSTAALEATGSLSVGLNTITVEVTAADGVTKQAYSIQIDRANIGATPPTDSSDLSGGSLTAPDGSTVTLDNPISPDTYQYSGTVPNSAETISLADLVIPQGATMTVTVNGVEYSGDISSIPLSEGDNVIVVTIHGADGYTQTYTFDIRRKTVTAELAGLVLTWSGMTQNQIEFSASKLVYDLTSYTLESSITSCSIAATKANQYQSVRIGGESLISKDITLVPGENIIAVEVTAEDGAPTQTYTIMLNRAAPKSANAALAGLSVTKCGTVNIAFSADTTAYGTFTQGYNVASYTVTAEKAESAQTVTINGTAGLEVNGALSVGQNTITIEVTAENGITKKDYTIAIVRDAKETDPPTDSSDITGGTVSGSDGSTVIFDKPIGPDTHSYTGTVENGTSTISLDGLTTNTGAATTITVNGEPYTGDISQIPLNEGDNVIIVVVHGADGYDQTYEFNIRRKTSTADLEGLTVIWNGVNENQISFDPAKTAYDLSSTPLDYAVSSCTVITTAKNGYQSISINGETASSKSVALPIGASTATVSVTAEDGVTKKDYTVALFRKGSNSPKDIQLVCGDINMRFDASTTEYPLTAASSIDTAHIMVTKEDESQSIVITAVGKEMPELSGDFSLGYGLNTVTVKVKASGVEDKTYTLKITRTDTANSTDATLRSIGMTGIVLIPRFDRNTLSYSAEVSSEISSTDVLPVAYNAAATVKVNGTPVTAAKTVSLAAGKNTITIDVVAQNPAHTQTYTVTVYRADGIKSNNSALTGISVSPAEAELGTIFSPSVLSYSANVENSISRVSISPQKAEAAQSVTVNGISVDYSSASVSVPVDLGVGKNTVEINVSAEDGISTRTYTLTFNRANTGVSNNANLSSLTISSGTLLPSFNKNCLEYQAFVNASVATIDVTPTVAAAASSVAVNFETAVSGSAKSVPLGAKGTDTIIKVTVTAQDGTTRTYTLTVNRATEEWSNNATLSSLSISKGTMLPSFSSSQLEYVANVDSTVNSVTLTAVQAVGGTNSKVTFNGNTSGTVSLSSGRNIIEVRSVAADGVATMTYTVQVYRREAGITLYFLMPSDWKGFSNQAVIKFTAASSSGTVISGTAAMSSLDTTRTWWSYTIVNAASTSSIGFQNALVSPLHTATAPTRADGYYWYNGSSWLNSQPLNFPVVCVNALPHAESEGYAIPFKDTKTITLIAGGADVEYSKYTLDNTDPSTSGTAGYYVNNMQLIIGQNMNAGDTLTLRLFAKTTAGNTSTGTYQYKKTGKAMTIHLKRPKTWSTSGSPTIHLWVSSNWYITGWKLGPEMTSEGNGWFSYTIDGLDSCGVLFMENNSVSDSSPMITADQTAVSSSPYFVLNGGVTNSGSQSNRATGSWYSTKSDADAASASYPSLY